MKHVGVKHILDTRYERKDNTFPIVLRIFHGSDWKHFPTGIRVTKKEYLDLDKKTLRDLNNKIAKATTIADELEPFDFDTFRKQFLGEPDEKLSDDVYGAFQERINSLRQEGKINTADWYENSLGSLKTFRSKLKFPDVTTTFIESYTDWLRKPHKFENKEVKGCGNTTISMYLRAFQAIINRAIAAGITDKSPFGRYKYTIPQSRNIKKALTKEEIGKIWKFEPPIEGAKKAKALWLFSYMANGINFKDMALLKKSDIEGDIIVFKRAKTEHKSLPPIRIYLTPQLKQIMKEYGGEGDYIFPILTDPENPEKVLLEIKNLRSVTNKWMKNIAEALKINKPITTYYARHSYITNQVRAGEPIQNVSESAGHANIRTTMYYYKGATDETLKRMANNLLPED